MLTMRLKMPKFKVNGFSTKKWIKTVEAKDSDEAWDIAIANWTDADVWDTDSDVVDIEEVED